MYNFSGLIFMTIIDQNIKDPVLSNVTAIMQCSDCVVYLMPGRGAQ